jgi:NAD(P)-dependent dehydrogenase (short-subunit alcohol dehydrogenase family)
MKKVVVVTGAGSGIGLAIASVFKNDAVLICGRTQSKIDEAVAFLKKEGVDVHSMACDVSNREDVEALAKKAQSLGSIRCLVNNAAVYAASAETIYKINMVGTVLPSELFLPLMAKDGIIINISSTGGHMYPMNDGIKNLVDNFDSPDLVDMTMKFSPQVEVAYLLSKRFVIEYTKSCCARYAKQGVRVLSISPGTFETAMLNQARETTDVSAILQITPAGRIADPIEIGHLVEFLAGDKVPYLIGTDIIIDGGVMSVFEPSMLPVIE